MKSGNSRMHVLYGAGLLSVLLSTTCLAATAVGVNAAIRNSVQMKTETDAALRPATLREQVHIGDAIASGPQSSLQMLLLDKSVFTVGANARLTIDRFVYDPNRGTSDIAASVAKGAFRFMSGNLTSGAGQSAIKTPVATIGVRGTIVMGVVGEDVAQVLAGEPGIPPFTGNLENAVLVLLSGPGTNNQGFDKPGAIDVSFGGATFQVETAGMAMLSWGAGQLPVGPFALSDAAYARLVALLSDGSAGNGAADTLGSQMNSPILDLPEIPGNVNLGPNTPLSGDGDRQGNQQQPGGGDPINPPAGGGPTAPPVNNP